MELKTLTSLTSQVNNPSSVVAISALQRLRGGSQKLITKVFIFVLEPELLPDAQGAANFKDHFLHNQLPRLRLPQCQARPPHSKMAAPSFA